MRRMTLRNRFLFTVTLILAGSSVRAAEPVLTGKQILEQAGKAYAACKTYRDTGTVVAEYTGPDGKKEGGDDKPRRFTTVFQHNGVFRFEFRNPNPLQGERARQGFVDVIWAKGDELKVQMGVDLPADTGKVSKVITALSIETGVTEQTSTIVPMLLLRTRKGGAAFAAFETARRLDDERVGKVDCHQVLRTYEMPNFEDGSKFRITETYWIDRGSNLIRRVKNETSFADKSRVVTTIHYEPEVDVKLAPAELEFNPPKKP